MAQPRSSLLERALGVFVAFALVLAHGSDRFARAESVFRSFSGSVQNSNLPRIQSAFGAGSSRAGSIVTIARSNVRSAPRRCESR